MKSNNLRTKLFNAGAQMLHQLTMSKQAQAMHNKAVRREKRNKIMGGYAGSGCGARECARRRQQMAYARGLVNSPCVPR